MSWNQNSSYGSALFHNLSSQLGVFGNVLVVVSSSDSTSHTQHLRELMTGDFDGKVRFFATVAAAYDAAESNNNDVILLDGQSVHTVTEMLTVAKNRVHFVGMDGGNRLSYQGARIYMGVTGVTTDLAPVLVTGNRNTFRNIKFENASTTNQSLYGFIDNGEGTFIENCSFVKTAGLDDANHAHFWMAGDSLNMKNVVIGQSNVPSSAAGFGILIDGKTGGGTDGTVKENFLENIYVNMSVANGVVATSCFVKVADDAALNFSNTIKDLHCTNFQPVGAAALTNAVLCPTGITAGTLSIVGLPSFVGCTGVADATVSGIYTASP